MKKIAFIYKNIKFKDKIEYCINTMFMNYKVDYDILSVFDEEYSKENYEVVIFYGNKEDNLYSNINIIESNLFSDYYLKIESLPEKVQYFKDLPIFFYDSKYNFFELVETDKIILNNDIIQSVFFFLTCYEEYVINDYDKFGRANIERSILYKSNLLWTPVVNKLINYFVNLLNEKFKLGIFLKPIWDDKKFASVISHDVDSISKFLPIAKELRLQLSLIIGDKKPSLFLRRLYEFINKKVNKSYKDPFDTFDYILSLEKQYNFKSTFYFMTDNKTYNVTDNLTKSILEKIKECDCEIGLHPGLGTSNDKHTFNQQKNIFLRDIESKKKFGVRQHYLSFISGNTWEIHNNEGVMYDTSICYPQVAGFKVGYCFPYKVYSLVQNKVMDLWEIPLIVMEGTLLQYMGLTFETAKEYCISLLDEIEEYNGVFVLLWHNSALSTEYNPYANELFEWIYEELSTRNCIVDSTINVVNKYAIQTEVEMYGH
jgi:hypothetical protein